MDGNNYGQCNFSRHPTVIWNCLIVAGLQTVIICALQQMCNGSISANIHSCALMLHANVRNQDRKHLSSKGPSCPCWPRESVWCGGSFAPHHLPFKGEFHYLSNWRICGSEGRCERFFGAKENLVPRIFGRTLRDLVTVPTELSCVSLSVRCLKQRVLSNDKLIKIFNFV